MTVASVESSGHGADFGFEQAIEAIAAESRRLAEVVGVVRPRGPRPLRPEWSVRDLAHHIGEVQWYWGENVRAQNAEERSGGRAHGAPRGQRPAGLAGMVHLLVARARCATRAPTRPAGPGGREPHTAGAVGRHQAQEVAVHRWDAEGVAGAGAPLQADLADDGVPEFMEIMVGLRPRLVARRGDADGHRHRGELACRPDAAPRPGHRSSRAPASDLVLMLYRRLPVPDADVEGDPMLVAALLSLADTS